ncbi:NAD(P)-dependent oxidoreductase [Raineya orbicola]|uniref:Phosphoglycerate dehydrogenase n=1 Tax=Raineya orbicola TaxID=2016530 RepID=A0A2N3IKP7_9BACT|nr:NAD(P)-dependent oxidoreductase [Raineya orbicola]PKQ70900.1 Phosphoglycerate dehydrogenase [Raineya orbicola]
MNFLIVDDLHPLLIDVFEQKNISYSYEPTILPQEIAERLQDFEAIVIRSKIHLNKAILSQNPQLKLIVRAGSGLDNIDVDFAEKQKIHLINAPEANCDAVAEHCLGMLFSLMNKIHTADLQVKQKIWRREANRGTELQGKTIGIIGYGHTGKAFARRLSNLGVKILCFDRNPEKADNYAQMTALSHIQQEADVISLHVSLNEQSRKMLNQAFIEGCSKPFWLLNTARGEVADLEAIVNALESGKILGAGLDVLENEKLDTLSPKQEETFQKLVSMPNVILTPHVAGWTKESYLKISQVLAEKILKYLNQ